MNILNRKAFLFGLTVLILLGTVRLFAQVVADTGLVTPVDTMVILVPSRITADTTLVSPVDASVTVISAQTTADSSTVSPVDASVNLVLVQDTTTQSTRQPDSADTLTTATVVLNVEQSESDEAMPLIERTIPPVTDVISFGKIFMSLVVLLMIWIGARFISAVLTNLSERFSGQRLLIKRLIPVTKVTLWSVAIYFVIAGILQPPLETIITVSASIGIAVGFASQDILRNIFGGIMIILDRPFQVGDKIEVDKQYGEVIQIGLRSVRLVTEDDSIVTVPNAEIMNKSVSNANSSALDCQVVAELFLPRSIDTNLVEQVCRKAATTSRFVYLNKPVYVHITHVTVGPKDYLKVRLKAYVLDIRYEQELRSDMTTLSMTEFNRLGILPA